MVISKTNFSLSLLLVICILLGELSCREDTLEDLYGSVLAKYDSIYSYQADLTQVNYWAEMDLEKTSEGIIYYDGEHFLLSYNEPAGQRLLITDEEVLIVDEKEKQAFHSDNTDLELRPDRILSFYWHNPDKEIIDADNGLALKINTGEDTLKVLINNDLIDEITIVDSMNNYVRYIFSNVIINHCLPDSIFDLKYSDEFNIIDNRNSTEQEGFKK